MSATDQRLLLRVAGATFLWLVLVWIVVDTVRGPTTGTGLLLAGAWAAVAATRRLRVLASLAVPLAVTVVAIRTGLFPNDSGSTSVALFTSAYLFGRRADTRAAVPGALAWLLACAVLAPLYDPLDPAGATDLVYPLLWAWLALAAGAAIRRTDVRARQVGAAAEAVHADLEAERLRALASERRRIATELNDVVMQTVGAMQVEASAARAALDGNRSDDAERALAALEEEGRAALDGLRRMLGVLRDRESATPVPVGPAAGLGDVLAARTAAGLILSYDTATVAALPPWLDLTAGRVVARFLDAVSAAGATRSDVRVDLRDARLHLEVTHDAPRSDPLQVAGVRERMDLYGGRLLADGTGGRWAATLPVGEPPDTVPDGAARGSPARAVGS